MIRHFDFIASVYDRLIGAPDIPVLKRLLDLPPHGWLLDAGGGTGRVSGLMKRADRTVVADLSRPMLKETQVKQLHPVCAAAESLPFPDNTFHGVLVVDALHHFHHPPQALRDLVRVLRPGSRLVIEEPDLNRKAVKLLALAEKAALMHSRFYFPESIRSILISTGSSAVIENGADRFRTWIVAEKPLA